MKQTWEQIKEKSAFDNGELIQVFFADMYIAELQAKVDESANALIQYGQHDTDCLAQTFTLLLGGRTFREPCTCGLDDAIAKAQEGGE